MLLSNAFVGCLIVAETGLGAHHMPGQNSFILLRKSRCVQQPKGAKLTMQEKNDTLDLLVSQGWLAHAPQSSNGYTIGVRCLQ